MIAEAMISIVLALGVPFAGWRGDVRANFLVQTVKKIPHALIIRDWVGEPSDQLCLPVFVNFAVTRKGG